MLYSEMLFVDFDRALNLTTVNTDKCLVCRPFLAPIFCTVYSWGWIDKCHIFFEESLRLGLCALCWPSLLFLRNLNLGVRRWSFVIRLVNLLIRDRICQGFFQRIQRSPTTLYKYMYYNYYLCEYTANLFEDVPQNFWGHIFITLNWIL